MHIAEAQAYLDNMLVRLNGQLRTAREFSYDRPTTVSHSSGVTVTVVSFSTDQPEGLIFEAYCEHGQMYLAGGFGETLEEATIYCAEGLKRTLSELFPDGMDGLTVGARCLFNCKERYL